MSSSIYKGLESLHTDEEACVNPQYTDKRYHNSRESQSSPASKGLVTPCPIRVHQSSRRPLLMLSDTTASCKAGPSSASSASSFYSSPDYPSSNSSSVSTAASSRRQSAIFHDGHHQYYSADSSPTPACRPERSTESFHFDQYCLQEPFHPDPQVVYSNASSFDNMGEAVSNRIAPEFFMPVNDYVDGIQMEWQDIGETPNGLSSYGLSEQNPASAYLGMDLVPNFSGHLAAPFNECPQMNSEGHQPGIFQEICEAQGIEPKPSLNPQALGPPIDFHDRADNVYMSASDDEGALPKREPGTVPHSLFTRKSRLPGRSVTKSQIMAKSGSSLNKSRCKHCTYACNRQEHLNRHLDSLKHNPNPKTYECRFETCTDKKGKRKIIVGRNDNFRAHYTKTHFSYGNTEKSGKNERVSMKASMDKGLRDDDYRWNMMLEGKMTMDPSAKSVWKMIGYSIRETREMKVKDIAPEWQGPDETKLEEFDVRWKALKNKTLDYEQAMSRGHHMKEKPEQGLLGVTMLETEEMGIKHLDVRWKLLLDGKMSIEDSKTLKVKEYNPAWIALQARCK